MTSEYSRLLAPSACLPSATRRNERSLVNYVVIFCIATNRDIFHFCFLLRQRSKGKKSRRKKKKPHEGKKRERAPLDAGVRVKECESAHDLCMRFPPPAPRYPLVPILCDLDCCCRPDGCMKKERSELLSFSVDPGGGGGKGRGESCMSVVDVVL